MKKITILMLHLKHGGAEKQTISMANALADRYEIEIVSLYNFDNFIAYPIDERIKVRYLLKYGSNRNEIKDAIKNRNIINLIKETFKAIKVLFNKKRVLRKYINNLKTDILFSTRIDFANIISKSNIDSNIITVAQEHNFIDNEKYLNYVKQSCAKINYLVVMSDISYKHYEKILSSTNTKMVIIPNILDHISEATSTLTNNIIMSAGRFHPVKNFTALIETFNIVAKNNQSVKLVLCGDGEEKQKIVDLIQIYGLEDKVILPGMVDSKSVEEYMLHSDLFVMTSLHECFPMVLLEANSCGVPVISFDVKAGPKAMINNNKNGFLVENNNTKVMADTIINYLRDKDMKVKMAKKSKEYATQFLASNIVNNWIDLFEKEK